MNMVEQLASEKLLHVHSFGQGPDVVLLHGWGMHSAYWQGLVDELKSDFRLHCIDLPGHGWSDYADERSINDFTVRVMQTIASITEQSFYLIGWSLGGLISQKLSLDYSDKVKRLILIASSPSFIRREGWQYATLESVFDGFALSLLSDYKKTLNRFISLQVRGSTQQQLGIRALKAKLFSRGMPDQAALKAGLGLLQQVDLRTSLSSIDKPVMVIGGEHDTLVPQAALPVIAGLLPQADMHIIKGAGHAPFLSHPEEMINLIKAFLENE